MIENDHVVLWNRCLNIIRDNVPDTTYKTWFEPIVPLKYEDHALTIGVPSPFFYEFLEEKLVPQVEQLLPKMDSILQSLNKLLADPALTATIHNAERLTANLDVTTRQLNSLMNNELPQITGRLVTITDNFSVISENLKGIDYASTFSKVDSTLYNVQLLTEKLTRKDNTIGLLFNDPTFYQNLSTTTANAASLLEDLKAHPKRYVHFSLFGKKDK